MLDALTVDSFDPVAPGHPESLWLELLAGVQLWAPSAGPLLVVSPHPDDEVLGAGGLIHSWAARGQSITVVSVTDGEAAYSDVCDLGLQRQRELRRALRALSSTHIVTRRLSLPDGAVSRVRNRLRNALSGLLTAGTTLVAPYERDGHPDHDAIGEVCMGVASDAQLPLVRYPIWRWHHGNPRDLHRARWGKFPLSAETRRAKSRAMACFTSQLTPASGQPILPPQILTYFERPFEAFIL